MFFWAGGGEFSSSAQDSLRGSNCPTAASPTSLSRVYWYVWDNPSNTAGNDVGGSSCYTAGAPACSTFTIPSQYAIYRDLSGNETAVPGPTIALSAEPIV